MTFLTDSADADRLLAALRLPEDIESTLHDPRYWSEAFCLALIETCDREIFERPAIGMELATLVPRLAERVPAERCTDGRIQALKGKAFAVHGSALRGMGRFDEAQNAYSLARPLLAAEGHPIELAELELRECTLRIALRDFPVALAAVNRAISIYRYHADRHLLGRALLVRGLAYLQTEDSKAALSDCSAALTHIDPARCQRSYFSAVANLGSALEREAQDSETVEVALAHVRKAKEMGPYPEGSVPISKLSWIEARILERLGEPEKAEAAFQLARQGLLNNGTPFELMLVGLDLAAHYLRRQSFRKVAKIAAEMFPLLRSVRAHREVYMALLLFHQAASAHSLTSETLSQVRDAVRAHGPAF